ESHGGAAEGAVARGDEEEQRALVQAGVGGVDGAAPLALTQEAEPLPPDRVADEIAEVVAGPRPDPRRQAHEEERGGAGARPERGERDDGRFAGHGGDRKSTRLNSSHVSISYAVFC